VDDVAAFIERLQRHEIACEPIRIDEFTGKRFTFFQDPDALPLEVYEG
jgi:glyoxylase I family protein